MVDKITGYQNLGDPNKIKWGRAVSETATKAITENERLRQDFDNNSSSTRTGMRVLSDQVLTLQQQQEILESQQNAIQAQQDYLNSLVTYNAAAGTITATGSPTTMTIFGDTNPSITFTLDEPRRIVATFQAVGTAVTGGSGTCNIFAYLRLAGAILPGVQGEVSTGGANTTQTGGTLALQSVISLPAGTHTIDVRYNYITSGVVSTVTVYSRYLIVDIVGV